MAGTLTISTLSDGTNSTSSTNCIQGSAKAWVNFNGSTAGIRASYNVSSVTRTAAGLYSVNFTTALADANYSSLATAIPYSNGATIAVAGMQNYNTAVTQTASVVYVGMYGTGGSAVQVDSTQISVACFR